jgi:Tfp pilus assembly protein PilN
MAIQGLNKTINLLNPILEPEDIWTRVYNWVTQIGKYILVFVCLLVLGVFFARFFLDKQNNDLTRDINYKIDNILSVEAKRQEEVRFRGFQNLTYDIQTLEKKQVINSSDFALVMDGLPSTFSLKSIAFNGSNINIALAANSFEEIARYTSELNSNELYKDVKVSVTKLPGSDGYITFTVSFTLVT